jgi:hypothetical protein
MWKEGEMRRLTNEGSLVVAGLLGVVALLAIFAVAAWPRTAAQESAPMITAPEMKPDLSLRLAMRLLWEDHLVYTRNYIISALAKLPDVSAVAGRLLRNQDDIGDAVKPYYGNAAGTKLASLLRDHILVATEVVKAAMGGTADELAKAQAKWTANADALAAFLSAANPHWPKATIADMLHKHLQYTTNEVVGRLKGDWEGDIAAYDQGHRHMLMFADMLTDGLIAQFPDRFKK